MHWQHLHKQLTPGALPSGSTTQHPPGTFVKPRGGGGWGGVGGDETVCHVKAALPVMLEIAMVRSDKLLKAMGVPHSCCNGPDKLVLISWRWVRDGKEPLPQDAGSVPVTPTPCI